MLPLASSSTADGPARSLKVGLLRLGAPPATVLMRFCPLAARQDRITIHNRRARKWGEPTPTGFLRLKPLRREEWRDCTWEKADMGNTPKTLPRVKSGGY